MTSGGNIPAPAARAFDRLAATYDVIFTRSLIGSSQRKAVLKYAERAFTPESRLLELNCGTGEDALHFARLGYRITACDISAGMISEAKQKTSRSHRSDKVSFHVCATEDISQMQCLEKFNGVFSNFSGLNCVQDLSRVAATLANLVTPGSPVLLCFSTRYCLWEIVWYLLHGKAAKAFRRWRGAYLTNLVDTALPVYYPHHSHILRSFSPFFMHISTCGIGITVPPSYVESLICKRPENLSWLEKIDDLFRSVPGIRLIGDHMLLHLERVAT